MLPVVILIKSIIHPGIESLMADIIDPGIMQVGSAGQFQIRFYPLYSGKIGRSPSARYFVRIVETSGIGDGQTILIFQVKIECSPYIVG